MKNAPIYIIIVAILIGGLILISGQNFSKDDSDSSENGNVSVVDGKQIIVINAKGGYSPRTTVAKAGLPTVVRIETNSTFDCSSALVIPSMDYRKNLPPSGETNIDVVPQEAGAVLNGLCAMGMYNFQIIFE